MKKNYVLLVLLLLFSFVNSNAQTPCPDIPPYVTQITNSTLNGTIYTVDFARQISLTANFDSVAGVNPAEVTYRWDFGGGAILNGKTVNFTYIVEGPATATLSTLYRGCTKTITINFNVQRGEPFKLYRQFNGRYDYQAIGNTLNVKENAGILESSDCAVLTTSSATLSLLPSQQIVAAYLYWAGSGPGDFNVKLNSTDIAAERTYYSTISAGTNNDKLYFGAFADVTNLVKSSGTYTVSDLDITKVIADDKDYCNAGINFAGWSIIIVYSNGSLPYNQVSIYDGFKTFERNYQTLEVYLNNLDVVSNLGAKIGFLAWEGDVGAATDESIKINGTIISNPPLNPANNPFNGTNSFTGASDLYNMDIDYYNIQNNINIGDKDLRVTLHSGQDAIILNNIVVVVNSELPDATIENIFYTGNEICGNRDLLLVYMAQNYNSTKVLPKGTPIAIYANDILIAQTATKADIAIGEPENSNITVTLPPQIPNNFTLKLVIDDTGNGTGIVREINEDNNTYTEDITLASGIDPQTVDDLTACAVTGNTAVFNLTEATATVLDYEVDFYRTEDDADKQVNKITDPENFTSANTTIYARIYNAASPACFSIEPFSLFVTNGPQINPAGTPFRYVLCPDAGSTNSAVITSVDAIASNLKDAALQSILLLVTTGQDTDLAKYTITYHTTNIDAQSGANPIQNGFTAIDGTSVFLRIEPNTTGSCFSVATIQFYIKLPVIINPTPLQVCGDGTSQTNGVFNLSDKDNEITGNKTGYIVRYYVDQATADTGGSDNLSGTGYNGTDQQIVYVRVDETLTGCFTITTLQLRVTPAPVVSQPGDFTICDDNYDGLAIFNLRSIEAGFGLDVPADYTITYHLSKAAADAGTAAITTPNAFKNTTANFQTIYVKVVRTAVPDCGTVFPLVLTVNPRPAVATITPFEACATPGTTTATFDLTTKNSEATSNTTDVVTYYPSIADANSDTNAISATDAVAYTTGSTVIGVRVTNEFGCWSVSSFRVTVNPLPVINTNMDPFYACEITPGNGNFNLDAVTPVITNGQGGFAVTYYTTQALAEEGLAANALPQEYSSETKTIYGRVVNTATQCFTTGAVQLEVQPAPIAPLLADIQECDPNNDKVATFNIQPTLDAILAAMGNVTLSVHTTIDDANHGTNPLTQAQIEAYNNVVRQTFDGIQVLYILVKSADTECSDIADLRLIVNPSPVAVQPTAPYAICDNGASDSDGNGIFDLTTYQTQILGANNPAQFTVSYHSTSADAEANTNAIATPASYESRTGTVYVRVTNNTTGCYDVVTLQLVVNPLPTAVQPTTTYTLCDKKGDTLAPEKEYFDLTTRIAGITGGVNGVTVTFHTNEADANSGTGAIPNPRAYINDTTIQAIYVRVANTLTGCYRTVLLDIEVQPLPELTLPTQDELTVCDTNGRGYGNFNLDGLTTGLINNGTGITIAFYENYNNAVSGINPIRTTGNYINIVPGRQVIYVVATNTVTGCQSVPYALTLIVTGAPQLPEGLAGITVCDDTDNNGQDGTAGFDLTVNEAAIRAALGNAVAITYYTTRANALDGLLMIASPEAYPGRDRDIIWVRVENGATGCFSVGSFTLRLNSPALLAQPAQLMQCDELPNDGQAEFDLTVREGVILGAQAGRGITLSYYASEEAYGNNEPAIANPKAYTNIAGVNPQVIYIKATTKEGCGSFTTLTIRVLNQPTPDTTPTALEQCDNDTDGRAVFNLRNAETDILDNESNATVTYYTTEAAANSGTPEIADPTAYESATGTVWVRVTMNGSEPDSPGCYAVVALPLVVNPLPVVSALEPFAICRVPSTGFETFDLVGYVNQAIGDAATAAGYSLGFYSDAAMALPITNPTQYTNTQPNQDRVYIRITNDATGCTVAVPLELYAEQGAEAFTAEGSILAVCDYEGGNDGVVTTNLTGAGTTALGGQDPATYLVSYYTSEAAAIAGGTTTADYIQDPTQFKNTQTPQQVIWIRVTNSATISKCSDVTSVTLQIEQLPNPAITTADGNYTLCFNFTSDALESGPLLLNSGVTPNGHTYDWYRDGVAIANADASSGTYEASEPGNYTVIVTSPAGCVSQPSAVFEVVRSGPAVAIGKGYVVSNAFSNNQTVTVLVEGYGEYQYSLYPEGPWQESNVFTNVSKGTHTVYVRDTKTPNACNQLELSGVSIIDYPNFFTPNQDGYNDTWNIVGLAGTDAKIYIFDRYGKLLKQLSPNSDVSNGEGWDGTFTGRPLPADDYWFTVTFTENGVTREFKSHFALKR